MTSSEGGSHKIDTLRVVLRPPWGISMGIYSHVAYPQAHTQTNQSLQITLHKYALDFEHVLENLLPCVEFPEN